MENINELFEEKSFSKEAQIYLQNAINEFEEIFGKYVSKEVLLERVKRNIYKIEFTDELDIESDCAIGYYNCEDKKIKIKNNISEEEMKSVFFHEFLHAIVADGKTTGFLKPYQIVDYEVSKGFIDLCIIMGRGFNEGFVQMMTQERDKKIANKVISTGYPILTSAVGKFCDLYGRENLIDLYFNNSEQFMGFMSEKSENFDVEFINDFDIIHKYENQMLKRKKLIESPMYKIFSEIIPYTELDKKMEKVQENIIQVYLDEILKKEIETPEELKNIMKNIYEIYHIFSKSISSNTLQRITEQLNPDIINDLQDIDYDVSRLIETQLEFENFKNLSTTEKLENLMDRNNGIIETLCGNLDGYNLLSKEYFSLVFSELYGDNREFQSDDAFFWIYSFSDVAKYILKNDLSFENLKIVYNKYLNDMTVFELHNLQEDGSYEKFSTLVIDESEDLVTREYRDVNSVEWIDLSKRIDDKYSTSLVEAVGDNNGNFVVNTEAGQLFVSNEFDTIEKNITTISIESSNENKLRNVDKKIENREVRLERLRKNSVPDFILQNEIQMLEDAKEEKKQLLDSIKIASKRKITPEKIEGKTINENVTIQSLELIMNDLLSETIEKEGESLNVE